MHHIAFIATEHMHSFAEIANNFYMPILCRDRRTIERVGVEERKRETEKEREGEGERFDEYFHS